MADILIKGMEMPKGLGKTITIYPNGTVRVWVNNKGSGELLEQRAVPVPPHGDLVDRDEIIEAGKSHPTYKNSKIVKAVVDKACCLLETATVVIPKNEGE